MNILILSAGSRNKIVQYFKRELQGYGKVIACDCSPLASALYDADKFFLVPKINDEGYINAILDICSREKINGLFSLIDPELSIIAKHKKLFEKGNVTCIVSDYDVIERSFNKMSMINFCKENNIPTIQSYDDIRDFERDYNKGYIDFPVFVKPIFGSCSMNIKKVENIKSLKKDFSLNNDLMVQEYMREEEIGADVYIDLISKEVISIFTKKKLLMRAGETDKAVSFKDNRLFDLIIDFVKKAGFVGHIDIDIFNKKDDYLISEVNPRFGGGYPHAYECGCNFPQLIINNLRGKANTPHIGHYKENIYMLKYLDLKIQEGVR